jgi:hypothetical protein
MSVASGTNVGPFEIIRPRAPDDTSGVHDPADQEDLLRDHAASRRRDCLDVNGSDGAERRDPELPGGPIERTLNTDANTFLSGTPIHDHAPVKAAAKRTSHSFSETFAMSYRAAGACS